jgi:hypothetical protein
MLSVSQRLYIVAFLGLAHRGCCVYKQTVELSSGALLFLPLLFLLALFDDSNETSSNPPSPVPLFRSSLA